VKKEDKEIQIHESFENQVSQIDDDRPDDRNEGIESCDEAKNCEFPMRIPKGGADQTLHF
jgi:hypothetical protein